MATSYLRSCNQADRQKDNPWRPASREGLLEYLQRLRVSVVLLALGMFAASCGRIVNIEYEPTNSFKGQGTVTVVPFRYEAAEDHRVRPREVETYGAARAELFLSQKIGIFYTEALSRELTRSGYTLEESGLVTVTGSVARFFVDWRETERIFELRVLYTIAKNGFTWECSSVQRGPNTLVQDGVLIRKGTADCVHRFIQAAQEAHIL